MKAKKGIKRLLSIALILCMVLAMSLPVFATSTPDATVGNPNVDADKTGVLLVELGVYTGDKENATDSSKYVYTSFSSGFLVNEETLITCYHSVHFEKEEYEALKDALNMDAKKADKQKIIAIGVYRDQVVTASIISESAQADLAILKLSQPLQNRKYIKISTQDLQTTAPCYLLGFPGGGAIAENVTPEDVSIEAGIISKKRKVSNVEHIMHSVTTRKGNSGGPLVNYAGSVIGIASFNASLDSKDEDYYFAISINELIGMMDPLGIKYSTDDEPVETQTIGSENSVVQQTEAEQDTTTVATEEADKNALKSAITSANDIDKTKYTDSTIKDFEDALTKADAVNNKADATQDEVDQAKKDLTDAQKKLEKKFPIPLPAIIAIVAAVIILIIVIVMVKGSGKKSASGYNDIPPYGGGGVPVGGAPYGGEMYSGKAEGGTTVLGGGAGDTTVLGGDSGATTVLSGGAGYGSLTRSKNGERITISKEQFKIGRERNRVDYCISDNTAVGRLHAIIVSRGGSTFVVDQNSTNCTFVNSVRATSNQEVRLNNGDKIAFADEEFTFNSF